MGERGKRGGMSVIGTCQVSGRGHLPLLPQEVCGCTIRHTTTGRSGAEWRREKEERGREGGGRQASGVSEVPSGFCTQTARGCVNSVNSGMETLREGCHYTIPAMERIPL